jgi:hypothetical protein
MAMCVGVRGKSCVAAGGVGAAGARHPGKIGAAPNGINRTDGEDIMWSEDVEAGKVSGYTWDNFRLNWRDPLSVRRRSPCLCLFA